MKLALWEQVHRTATIASTCLLILIQTNTGDYAPCPTCPTFTVLTLVYLFFFLFSFSILFLSFKPVANCKIAILQQVEFQVIFMPLIFDQLLRVLCGYCTNNMMLAWQGSEREASDDFIFFVLTKK